MHTPECGVEELQRLNACDRLLHLLHNISSKASNHTFILILFDLMLKSISANHRIPLTSLANPYKFTLPYSLNNKSYSKLASQTAKSESLVDADRSLEKDRGGLGWRNELLADSPTKEALSEKVALVLLKKPFLFPHLATCSKGNPMLPYLPAPFITFPIIISFYRPTK